MQVTRVGAASEKDLPTSGIPKRLFVDLVVGSPPLLASRLRELLCYELQRGPSNQVIKCGYKLRTLW